MAIFKRGKIFWMDAVVNGHRFRESLGTTDARKAPSFERERIIQLQNRAPDPTRKTQTFGSMTIDIAIPAYIEERRAQVSHRMTQYWLEQSRPLSRSTVFKSMSLKKLTPAHIAAYQNERKSAGRSPKTINGEVSVLRQLLKHARLWYRFVDDYKPVPNDRRAVGRALSETEAELLFAIAKTRPDWKYAYTAAILSFYCGMRSCEIKGLQWKDIDFENRLIEINRSKTPAGWRTPSLNQTCLGVLRELFDSVSYLGANLPNHFVFPWHGREQMIDPTRPMTSWRTAWRSIRKKAGLENIRFHDGRHTAITTLAENGTPDWVIQAQVGHVDPQMMKTYSHIRRKALDEAAAALEPRSSLPDTAPLSSRQANAPLIG